MINMATINKSYKCLQTALESFSNGEVELAIRSLNITFNHATNKDWSPADTHSILTSLSWLYFYESRYEQVVFLLEHAVAHAISNFGPGWRQLSHLHYNLAEAYYRVDEIELCKKHFSRALDLTRLEFGIRSKTFQTLQRRFDQLHKLETIRN